MGFQRAIPHQIFVSRSKEYAYLRVVQKPYGYNYHIDAIWRAKDAVKLKQEDANRGENVFF
jgi:hypothetical protein